MKNNIENKIKQEFQDREIKPSKNSWDILNAQLEASTTKKENKKLKLLAYAAIFIGLLFSLLTFFNNNEDSLDKPIIVDLNEQKIKDLKLENEIIAPKKEIVDKTFNIQNSTLKGSKKEQVIVKTEIRNRNIKKSKKDSKNLQEILQYENEKNQKTQNNLETIALVDNEKNKDLVIENKEDNEFNKPKSALNLIEQKSKDKLFSTDQDIDLLLANALNGTTKNQVNQVTIQTSYLQYAVESEINKPVKNKILKTLKAGVNTVGEYITSNN